MRILGCVVVVSVLCACDPEAPGATGTVDLGPGADTSGFSWLHVAAHADADGELQVSDLVLESGQPFEDIVSRRVALSDVSFPWSYELGGGVGATEIESWRVTAWIGATEDEVPVSGDLWGSTPFEVAKCGRMGFCGVRSGVDVVIDTTVE